MLLENKGQNNHFEEALSKELSRNPCSMPTFADPRTGSQNEVQIR
jgi:hypothetical protein